MAIWPTKLEISLPRNGNVTPNSWGLTNEAIDPPIKEGSTTTTVCFCVRIEQNLTQNLLLARDFFSNAFFLQILAWALGVSSPWHKVNQSSQADVGRFFTQQKPWIIIMFPIKVVFYIYIGIPHFQTHPNHKGERNEMKKLPWNVVKSMMFGPLPVVSHSKLEATGHVFMICEK